MVVSLDRRDRDGSAIKVMQEHTGSEEELMVAYGILPSALTRIYEQVKSRHSFSTQKRCILMMPTSCNIYFSLHKTMMHHYLYTS